MGALLDIVTKDSVNRSLPLRMADSTDGTPETGVVAATAGLDIWYRREGAAKVSLTESDLAALTTAHTDGGLLHISDGEYRVDFPDAAFATGVNYVDVGWGATGMVGYGGRVRLVNVDLEDAVRAGLTALPNAAADAAGGLPISDAGGLDLDAKIGALTFTVAGDVDVNVQSWKGATAPAMTGDAFARLGAPAGASVSADVAALPTQAEITGGAYALDTDANGRLRIVDGTGAGELDTLSGTVLLRAANEQVLADWVNGGRLDLILDELTTQGDTNEGILSDLQFAVVPSSSASVNDATATTTEFDTTLTEADGHWNDHTLVITSGTLAGQTAPILTYVNASGHITLAEPLTAAPPNGAAFSIKADHVHPVSQIADAVWDEATSGHSTAGTTGKALSDILVDTAEIGAAGAGLTALATAAALAIVDGNVDSILADTGTDGVVVNAAGLATDAVNEIRNAITGGAYALNTSASGSVRVVDGTGTDEISLTAGLIAGIAGTIQTLDALDTAQDVEHDATQAAIAALNDLSAADVNAEMVDVLATDTYAEPGAGAPGATVTLAYKIGLLYKLARNKSTNDGTDTDIYGDDGSTVHHTRTTSDDGSTTTVGELGAAA